MSMLLFYFVRFSLFGQVGDLLPKVIPLIFSLNLGGAGKEGHMKVSFDETDL